jgi:hypothetical protein
MKRVMKLLHR